MIVASRLMIGGRVFSKGDIVSQDDLGPIIGSVRRSGAVKPVTRSAEREPLQVLPIVGEIDALTQIERISGVN